MAAPSKFSRLWKHATTTRRVVTRALPDESMSSVEKAIGMAERGSSGQIRLVVECHWPLWQVAHQSARSRALEWFSHLRVWDTEHNNGVLIYLLFAEHDVEILADRGFNGKVSAAQWEAICKTMEANFREGRFDNGLAEGVNAIGELLRQHFAADMGKNEQSDRPLIV
jgi:uncharacterized membrane protein